ncbi:Putative LOC101863888 [Caligus rogercresseyi]|uniref:LOC101863888 n=1 Tax=Caligus rogercresseyi TaxID=217165 RepID=A0A7T8KG11_CALRO|nr:Putative LOC101863888 [Caligus rogercresseyi]
MEHVNKESNETLWNSETKKSLLQLLLIFLNPFPRRSTPRASFSAFNSRGDLFVPCLLMRPLASRLQGFIAGLRPQDFPFAERDHTQDSL